MVSASQGAPVTFLFTDIEGSTRLWELEPERMQEALARHDVVARSAVEAHHGQIVKMTGDGLLATFCDPAEAIAAAIKMQLALEANNATGSVNLRLRCGVHIGVAEQRDKDVFGPAVNRAARLMASAHGGQVLVSRAIAALVADRLPPAVTLRDLGPVRLRDLLSAEHVYQVLHPEITQEFPPLRSLEETPNNLPQSLTTFVGREQELAVVRELLAGSRLVTLVGTGGVGKTRLSLEIAHDVLDDFPDGVWLVELASTSDPKRIPELLTSALRISGEPATPLPELLKRFVRQRSLLIVLDNCEHLVAACADLAVLLLNASSSVKILATSREPLRAAGEKTYLLQPLPLPDRQIRVNRRTLDEFPAARLFVDRASAALPTFRVTDENAPAIAAICRLVDGIPLAIELAGARVRAMTVEAIAERVSDRFRLLVGGNRGSLPHHRTIRALIDWSYEQLIDTEKIVFGRLAVFSGGWTMEAAEMVCAGGCVPASDVLEILVSLVEKSLVVQDTSSAGRYRFLETVRQYATERLGQSEEAGEAAARHASFYVLFAEQGQTGLAGPSQLEWLKRLDAEQDNFVAAHGSCGRLGVGAELGLRLVVALQPYWVRQGALEVGRRLVAEALARSGAESYPATKCRALWAAAELNYFMGRYADSSGYVGASLDLARTISDTGGVAEALRLMGYVELALGESDPSRHHFLEALALSRQLGDLFRLAKALTACGNSFMAQGEAASALRMHEEALSVSRELGDVRGSSTALHNLADALLAVGNARRAEEILYEALSLDEALGTAEASRTALKDAATLAAAAEAWIPAARFFGALQAHLEQFGYRLEPTDEAPMIGLIQRAREALGPEAFAVNEASGRSLSSMEALAELRVWLERQIGDRMANDNELAPPREPSAL